jgi:hypothetical protein
VLGVACEIVFAMHQKSWKYIHKMLGKANTKFTSALEALEMPVLCMTGYFSTSKGCEHARPEFE